MLPPIVFSFGAIAQGEIEQTFWESISCDSQLEVVAYIEAYPGGFYITKAEQCLAAISPTPNTTKSSDTTTKVKQSNLPVNHTKTDKRINGFLQILKTDNDSDKIQMLERLQWSGISDPRLFDVIEKFVLSNYEQSQYDAPELKILANYIRALGYSGNMKYQSTLSDVSKQAASSRVTKYAKRALQDLDKFAPWVELIANSNVTVKGKSAEVEMYMRMINVNNIFVQRLAARAIFHERINDQDLLNLIAKKLKSVYLRGDLDRQSQDTAAWFCKAIGQSAKPEFTTFLKTVSETTPHKRIQKHAKKYAS